ncbi:MAG: hypothetical protein PHY09_00865 [Desulfuromonadaceae bacterium]|nr:hypothetical protein [Desulfuromonadaceae bacterium]MDD5104866.1 hypothetical protein [Desulfuromonadaceae bacterium]
MTVHILKPCEVRHNSALLQLKPGEYLTLSEKHEEKLISAELARPVSADDIRLVVNSFDRPDLRGRWDSVKLQHLEAWSEHIKAILAGDVSAAVRTFNTLLT